MKMYSTIHPSTLMNKTREMLLSEGYDYEQAELPVSLISSLVHKTRSLRMGTATTASDYWSCEFTLYVDDPKALHSPYAPAKRELRSAGGIWAATFNQWGLWLGAMFDVAHKDFDPHDLRLAGSEYDPISSRAMRRDDGEPFNNSADLFHHLTCGQFSTEMRERQTVNLSCRVHRWESGDNGLSRCRNCGHLHRFGGRWQEQVHD